MNDWENKNKNEQIHEAMKYKNMPEKEKRNEEKSEKKKKMETPEKEQNENCVGGKEIKKKR